ncbi:MULTISPECIES: hypothetical protein [Micromonospora]|uniref:Uncharacterized protein n=1 Tax=Micromonospora sicca TaxID=2202420 RepID=A0A317DN39_9ACTN|nr:MULTISPECIES: hypothetical protein [unclassified Micromonospora]MBM0225918.1 hypothetical protein [Micromonospora sp. ATA51]MDZ5443091.1 hypothetical protein [Micromonospora sp. 4G57]MDZ5488197.1 hypothetical protein [Micromonospora sp. 4G53]PWR15226.1 hypothetical protein DKT69_12290 [Micromonospora sp. 4G51]
MPDSHATRDGQSAAPRAAWTTNFAAEAEAALLPASPVALVDHHLLASGQDRARAMAAVRTCRVAVDQG